MDISKWSQLEQLCEQENSSLAEVIIRYEMNARNSTREKVWNEVEQILDVMIAAYQTGLTEHLTTNSGMVNNDGKKLHAHQPTFVSPVMKTAMERAIANNEVNSAMGRIAAAPTAGSSGVMPGAVTAVMDHFHLSKEKAIEGILVGSAIGLIIRRSATLAGALGGCQAEIGSAAGMAAAAVTYMMGGTMKQMEFATCFALETFMGLVCDPVAGLVEVPCIMRNGQGAAVALTSAEMALAGITSVIPLDDVISAQNEVGNLMPVSLKETSQAGLANCRTAREIIEPRVLIKDIEIKR